MKNQTPESLLRIVREQSQRAEGLQRRLAANPTPTVKASQERELELVQGTLNAAHAELLIRLHEYANKAGATRFVS